MKAKKPIKTKSAKLLRQVGLWATIWWAVSGLYLVLVVWLAKDYYAQQTASSDYQSNGLNAWGRAIHQAYAGHSVLAWLAIGVVAGWAIGAIIWLKALKQAKLTYRDGLKDLFLSLR